MRHWLRDGAGYIIIAFLFVALVLAVAKTENDAIHPDSIYLPGPVPPLVPLL